MKTLCFTGHRRLSDVQHNWLAETLPEVIERAIHGGYTRFISGGALGFDQLAAESVIWLKDSYPVTLWVAMPFYGYADKWPERQRAHSRKINEQADQSFMVSKDYSRNVYQIRNEWMVNHSDVVVAAWNGTPSGTANTVNYAKSQGKKILRLDLVNFNEEWQKD